MTITKRKRRTKREIVFDIVRTAQKGEDLVPLLKYAGSGFTLGRCGAIQKDFKCPLHCVYENIGIDCSGAYSGTAALVGSKNSPLDHAVREFANAADNISGHEDLRGKIMAALSMEVETAPSLGA